MAQANRSCRTANLNIAAILIQSPEQAAASLRETLSPGGNRVDVVELAKTLGCRVSTVRISATGTVQADLCPDTSRNLFYLRVDPEPSGGWDEMPAASRKTIARHRLRFRVSHELGHTFFYERHRGEGPRRARRWSSREEEWCDEFARSLLVPATVARALPATAESVFRLQRRFDVSLEVAGRALANAHENAAVAIWFWPPDAEEPREALLHQWASCEMPALRRWRRSTVVEKALAEGVSSGQIASLSGSARQVAATARCGRQRRQIVVVAG
jgi:uncharacterized protein DUF955